MDVPTHEDDSSDMKDENSAERVEPDDDSNQDAQISTGVENQGPPARRMPQLQRPNLTHIDGSAAKELSAARTRRFE